MTELMIAVALWCGPPHRPIGLNLILTSTADVDACRRRIITCLSQPTGTGVVSYESGKATLSCFSEQKLP